MSQDNKGGLISEEEVNKENLQHEEASEEQNTSQSSSPTENALSKPPVQLNPAGSTDMEEKERREITSSSDSEFESTESRGEDHQSGRTSPSSISQISEPEPSPSEPQADKEAETTPIVHNVEQEVLFETPIEPAVVLELRDTSSEPSSARSDPSRPDSPQFTVEASTAPDCNIQSEAENVSQREPETIEATPDTIEPDSHSDSPSSADFASAVSHDSLKSLDRAFGSEDEAPAPHSLGLAAVTDLPTLVELPEPVSPKQGYSSQDSAPTSPHDNDKTSEHPPTDATGATSAEPAPPASETNESSNSSPPGDSTPSQTAESSTNASETTSSEIISATTASTNSEPKADRKGSTSVTQSSSAPDLRSSSTIDRSAASPSDKPASLSASTTTRPSRVMSKQEENEMERMRVERAAQQGGRRGAFYAPPPPAFRPKLGSNHDEVIQDPPTSASGAIMPMSLSTSKNSKDVKMMRRVSVGWAETIGKRPTMEDAWAAYSQGKDSSALDIFGVFDGHRGDSAAKYAAEHLPTTITSIMRTSKNPSDWLRLGIAQTNRAMMQAGIATGTTVVVGMYWRNVVYLANAGDSRCVHGRVRTTGNTATRMTQDHKPERLDETERIIALGGEVQTSVNKEGKVVGRVNGRLGVSRAMGDFDLQPYVIADPEITMIDLLRCPDTIVEQTGEESSAEANTTASSSSSRPTASSSSPAHQANTITNSNNATASSSATPIAKATSSSSLGSNSASNNAVTSSPNSSNNAVASNAPSNTSSSNSASPANHSAVNSTVSTSNPSSGLGAQNTAQASSSSSTTTTATTTNYLETRSGPSQTSSAPAATPMSTSATRSMASGGSSASLTTSSTGSGLQRSSSHKDKKSVEAHLASSNASSPIGSPAPSPNKRRPASTNTRRNGKSDGSFEIDTLDVSNFDFLIIACDGLWDVVNDDEAVNIATHVLQQGRLPEEAAKRLRNIAYGRGSADNITVLVVVLQPPSTGLKKSSSCIIL